MKIVILAVLISIFSLVPEAALTQNSERTTGDTVSSHLMDKKWYVHQMVLDKQTMDVPAEQSQDFVLFTPSHMEESRSGNVSRQNYKLDVKNRMIVFDENAPVKQLKIAAISRDELRLLSEGMKVMMVLRTKPVAP